MKKFVKLGALVFLGLGILLVGLSFIVLSRDPQARENLQVFGTCALIVGGALGIQALRLKAGLVKVVLDPAARKAQRTRDAGILALIVGGVLFVLVAAIIAIPGKLEESGYLLAWMVPLCLVSATLAGLCLGLWVMRTVFGVLGVFLGFSLSRLPSTQGKVLILIACGVMALLSVIPLKRKEPSKFE